MRKSYSCLICRGVRSRVVFKKNDFVIRKCLNCGYARLIGNVSVSYDEAYFKKRWLDSFVNDSLRKYLFVKRYLADKSKILDFGCGLGDFIYLSKNGGFDVFGYDCSDYARKYVLDKCGVRIKRGEVRISLFKENFFDSIVSFDVIEHIDDFYKVLLFFNRWLKKGGLVFITTPNLESWDAKLLGGYWYGFKKIPEHINYFTHLSISKILSEAGFSRIEVINWGFERDLNFLLGKLFKFSRRFAFLRRISFFVPVADMMVIAKK